METRAFDAGMILEVLPDLLAYLDVTLFVAGISIAAGSLLGGLLAWANLDGGRPLRALAAVYVYVMRCTPSIVLLFIVFYGLPKLLQGAFGIDMNGMNRAVFAVITFTLLFAGLSPVQAFAHVMLPQAAIVTLPNFGNASINLLKEGSLAYTIGLIDLIGKGNLIIAQNFGAYGIEIYLACMLVYWAIVLLLEQAFMRVERRLDKGASLRVETPARAGAVTGGGAADGA